VGDQLSDDRLDCTYTQPNVSGQSEQVGRTPAQNDDS
jgi:hypothetical protein